MFASKRGSYLSEDSSSRHRGSSLGKASDRDRLDTFGGPFIAFHAANSGNPMMCWIAASDSDTDVESVVREDPHRRTAVEMTVSRLVEVGPAGGVGNSIFND